MSFSRESILLLALALVWTTDCDPQVKKQEVIIKSSDGFSLAGRFHSSGESGPGILLLHQCNRGDGPTGYEELVVLLVNRGFNVLELDFRGFGGSRDDQYSEFRSQMDATAPRFPDDVEAAYQYLIAEPEVDDRRIGVVGASCGASQAIFLANNHESVKALVFLSGSLWQGAREAFGNISRLPIFVATSEDDRVTKTMSELFSVSESSHSQFLLYKGALHGTPLFGLDISLEQNITEWFDKALNR